MDTINNSMDIIDSRDVIERISHLRALELKEEMDDEEEQELIALGNLASECESFPDWPHGEVLIRNSYFRYYAQELAEDIGAIDRNLNWPYTCIDWDKAASLLQMDYSAVDFNGVTYWIRS